MATCHLLCFLLIAVTQVTSQLNTNLALNKATRQSSTYDSSESFSSRLAVNGYILPDVSHTLLQKNQWWSVDLGGIYIVAAVEMYNRPTYSSRLSKISLLITTDLNPPNPYLLAGPTRLFDRPWIEQSFQEAAYGEMGVVSLSNVHARHVCIFSSGESGVTLMEVLVFPDICNNLAEAKSARQSSNGGDRLASYGIDGWLNQFSATSESQHQWWMVSLFALHQVHMVKIYGRTDCCQDRYSSWAILSSDGDEGVNGPAIAVGQINRTYSESWREASFITGIIGERKEVLFPSVSARHVAVVNVLTQWGIYLRELQVFGCQCVLPDAVRAFQMVSSVLPGCVTLSLSFTNEYCRSAGFKYEYSCTDQLTWTSKSTSFSEDLCFSSSGKLITCQIRACLGNYCYMKQINASTSSCQKPSPPSDYSFQLVQWSASSADVSVTWKVPDHNCMTIVRYEAFIVGPQFNRTLSSTSPTILLNQLNPCYTYSITVTATNEIQLSSSPSGSSLNIPSLIVSNLANKSSIEVIDSKCLSIQIPSIDKLPQCLFQRLKAFCKGTDSAVIPAVDMQVCGLNPGRTLTCMLALNDSDKNSTDEIGSIKMPCEDEEVLKTSNIKINSSCIKLSWVIPQNSKTCDLLCATGWCRDSSRTPVTIQIKRLLMYEKMDACGFYDSSSVECQLTAVDESACISNNAATTPKDIDARWIAGVSVAAVIPTIFLMITIMLIWKIRRQRVNNKSPILFKCFGDRNNHSTDMQLSTYENNLYQGDDLSQSDNTCVQ